MNKLDFAYDKIQEEAAEVIQAVSKVKHFGFWSTDPTDPKSKPNIVAFHSELNDLLAAVAFMNQVLEEKPAYQFMPDYEYIVEKIKKLEKYYEIVSSLKGINDENQ
jgi:NTP pyrophosphatase (non-canonical NTP hydrolase)